MSGSNNLAFATLCADLFAGSYWWASAAGAGGSAAQGADRLFEGADFVYNPYFPIATVDSLSELVNLFAGSCW